MNSPKEFFERCFPRLPRGDQTSTIVVYLPWTSPLSRRYGTNKQTIRLIIICPTPYHLHLGQTDYRSGPIDVPDWFWFAFHSSFSFVSGYGFVLLLSSSVRIRVIMVLFFFLCSLHHFFIESFFYRSSVPMFFCFYEINAKNNKYIIVFIMTIDFYIKNKYNIRFKINNILSLYP